MPQIELDPLAVPETKVVRIFSERVEGVLDRRNSFVDSQSGEAYEVSKSAVLPSDFFPDRESFELVRQEHAEHAQRLMEMGIDISALARTALTGNLLTERNLPQYQTTMVARLLISSEGKLDRANALWRWIRMAFFICCNTWLFPQAHLLIQSLPHILCFRIHRLKVLQ